MRILFVNHAFPGTFGSLAAAFAESGHEVFFASGFRRRDFSLAGVRHIVLAPPREGRALSSSRYAPGLEVALAAGGQALHAFTRLGESGMAPDMVVASANDGYGLFCEEAFPQAFRVGWAEGAHLCPGAAARGEVAFTRHLLQCRYAVRSHLFLCPGLGEGSAFSSCLRHGVDVPCAVNTDCFSPGEKVRVEIALFYAGREGTAEELAMIADFLAARAHAHAAVLSDSSSVRERWKEAFADMPRKERLHVPERLSLEDYRRLLRSASLVVFPHGSDLPPSLLLEGMSCGAVPVLPEGEGPSFLRHGENAFFFRREEGMRDFFSGLPGPGALLAAQTGARQEVLARFEQKKVTAQCMSLLLGACGEWKKTR